ncbi:MAG: CsbD family protein [Roseinatronobacter sp.]|nr:CsbD family protein [Roseinatronobacter sp.]
MDKNRIKGRLKQTEGTAKDTLGKLTDNPKLQAKGKIKTAEGSVQEAFGKARDAAPKK